MVRFYQSCGQNAFCGLTSLGLPRSNETPVAGAPGAAKQQCERDWLVCLRHPPGAGQVFLLDA